MQGDSLAHSKQPLYQQLATVFRRKIESGEWARGMRLPTLDQFMAELGVGRVTVRAALAELEAEGLVSRARGQGTFVTDRGAAKSEQISLAYTWSDLVEFGRQSASEVSMDKGDAPRALPSWCQHEGIAAEQYHRLERISLRGEQRVAFSVVYIASPIYLRWHDKFKDRSVITVFDEAPEIAIGQALQSLTIISAGDDTASRLKIPVGSPIAEVIRRVYAPDRRLLYWSRVHLPSKYVRVEFDLLHPRQANAA
ncbi:MAG: GntR family transcriptional regulator [Burkholderiales bacterium]